MDAQFTELHAAVTAACARSRHVLHVLHALQQQFRHISRDAINAVAKALDLPVGQVESVVAFYSFFTETPRGKYDILLSNCTSCGCDSDLIQTFTQRLKIRLGQTSADGLVSLNETSCIGMCDHGASLLINGVPITNLDSKKALLITNFIQAQTPLSGWPVGLFTVHDNIHRKDLLLNEIYHVGDGLTGLLARGTDATLAEIQNSGLRGRGGAGFSTGMKWKFCREAQGKAHYVVCNADEGEPGTFKDRILLHSHADQLFEGMTVAGHIIGAKQGFLYLRGEYRYLLPQLEATLARRREKGWLGKNILSQFDFDIEIVVGAGAYICGEESALIESLEGKRGVPRVRPPFPVTSGYLNQPTIVNNVETFVAACGIAQHGGQWFRAIGTENSAGSKILSVSGDCAIPGIYEYPFGVTVQQVLDDCGAKNVQAVQIGGPSGTLISSADFQRRLCFEDLPTGGSFMIYGEHRDVLQVIKNFTHFFAHESCGFCTPCRVGTTLLKRNIDKIVDGYGTAYDMDEIRRMSLLVNRRSHCGLGQTAANPILHALQRFPQTFEQRLVNRDYVPHFDLENSLAPSRHITGRDDEHAHLTREE